MFPTAVVALALAASSSVAASPLACTNKAWTSFQAKQFLNWETQQPYVQTFGTVEAVCPSGATAFTFNVVNPASCAQLNAPSWYPQWDLYKNVSGGTQFVSSGIITSGPTPITGQCVKGGFVDVVATWNVNMTASGMPQTTYTLTFA